MATTGERLAPAQEGKMPVPRAVWVDPNRAEPNGTKYRTFASSVLGADVSYLVYLPPRYDEETRKYPVIYWLHGLGGNQRAGATGFLPHVAKAIRQGDLPPAIVVLVNGVVSSFYCDWADGKRPVESVIVRDLIPHIDETYRTVARREGRVIQGYSMGGFGAAHLAFKYPQLFGTVVVDAGALIRERALQGPRLSGIFQEGFAGDIDRFMEQHPTRLVEKNAEQIRSRMRIRIGVGSKDDLLPRNRELHELLERLKIEHEYEVVPEVAHSPIDYYRKLGANGLALHKSVFEPLLEDR
jgi:endo-1,4-beta-xylanase